MKRKLFYTLVLIVLAAGNAFAQTPPNYPTQHIYVVPQHNLHDNAFIADSVYANGNHDSVISIDYKIFRNDTLIDTISKYGWAYLKLRQMGTEYVSGNFDSGTFVFPEAIPFAGMVAHSFTISVINSEPGCNRGRVPMLYMHFDVPGTYKVIMEIYSQKNYKLDYIGTMACGRYKDGYCLNGSKRAVWNRDSVIFVVHPSFIHSDTASICQGDVYRWRGNDYLTSGTYKDVLVNQDGSDSVYQLVLNVIATTNSEKSAIICQGNSYYWRGRYYTQAGVYLDSVVNKNGCKDRYKLTLSVRPRYLEVDTVWRCENTSFKWRGRTISSAGLHTWTYTPVYHCDSVYQLRVFNYPVYTFRDTVAICSGNTCRWQGGYYTQSGKYTKKYRTANGCDSLYELYLTVDDGFLKSDTLSVCLSGAYSWRGRQLTSSGIYTDSLKNRYGCDSVYRLVLDLRRTYYTEVTDAVCASETYVWQGHSVNIGHRSSGIYIFWDSLKTVSGCDSVFRLQLTVRPTYLNMQTASACDNGIYVWEGHPVNIGRRTPGTYVFWDSLTSVYGCDSIHKLTLTVHPSHYFEVWDTICDNELFVWKGHSVTIGRRTAGTYVFMDSLRTKWGCDSVYKLTLTVYPTYFTSMQDEVCSGTDYAWQGHAVAVGTLPPGRHIVWDSLKTVHGCDSLFRLDLTVRPVYFNAQTASVCENDVYVWKNHTVPIGRKAPGTYVIWDSLKTMSGCDSVFRLTLTVYRVRLYADTSEICEGGYLLWRGRRLTAPGVYDDSLKTVHGCDSIFRKVLVVRPSYLFEEIVPICNNDVHVWRGRQLVTPGTYTDSLKSVWGCDSVYRLVLRVNPVYLIDDTLDGCENGTYAWRGRPLVMAGVYMDSLKAQLGCDSVFRLLFRLHPVTVHSDTVSVCAHDGYRWHGRYYGASGHFADTLQDIWGCDSICLLHLTVRPDYVSRDTLEICNRQQTLWRGKYFSREGLYSDSLHGFWGCDSVFTLYLKVHPAYLFTDSASICSHETFVWHGRALTADGVYYDSLRTARGCDSVFRLRLTVRRSYYYYDTVEICSGSYHTWRGRVLSRDGSYSDSLVTMENCPEVHNLRLKVNPVYLFMDTADICSGDAYIWHGRTLQHGGVYTDSLQTVRGCDSVYVLCLHESPSYLYAEKAEICRPQTCFWRGRQFTESGVYDDTLHTSKGCDSIFRMQLTVHSSYLVEEEMKVCGKGPVTWRGRSLAVSGVYVDSLKTVSGCDSVFSLRLQMSPTYYFSDSLEICGNESHIWHGRSIDRSGVYYDSLKTVHGCDSVYCLALTVYPFFAKADTADLCDGGQYLWRDRKLKVSGYYYDSLKTVDGCDSVYSLLLRVHSVQMTNDFAEICEGESYVWNGRVLTRQGRYIDTLSSQFGCDSIVRFFLYTYPMFVHPDTVDFCGTGAYVWRGKSLSVSGCYSDSLKTVNGCDSIFILQFNVRPNHVVVEEKTICDNRPYMWHGKYYNVSGIYDDSLHSQYGCDSVLRLRLTVNPSYLNEERQQICQGQRYQWRGRMLYSGGVYIDSLKSVHGCDSVFKLTLDVQPAYRFADTVEICQGERHIWRGKPFTTDGCHTDSLKTVHGCDSVYVLRLYVHPTYFSADTMQVCDNTGMEWHGRKLTESGRYYDSLKTVNGCDSVCCMQLQVNPTFRTEDTVVLCEDALPYLWHGSRLEKPGDYSDSLLTVHGCDSLFLLHIIVRPVYSVSFADTVCEGVPYNLHGFDIPADSTVGITGLQLTDSLKSIDGCDSVVNLSLTIRVLPQELHAINGDTLISRPGTYMFYTDTLSGITSYEWQVFPSTIGHNASEARIWLELDKDAAGWDTLKVIGHHACGQTRPTQLTIHVTIGVSVTEAALAEGVRAFPNPAYDAVNVELSSYEEWVNPRWALCDVHGRMLARGEMETERIQIRLDSYPRGIYLVRLFSDDGRECSLKIVKY